MHRLLQPSHQRRFRHHSSLPREHVPQAAAPSARQITPTSSKWVQLAPDARVRTLDETVFIALAGHVRWMGSAPPQTLRPLPLLRRALIDDRPHWHPPSRMHHHGAPFTIQEDFYPAASLIVTIYRRTAPARVGPSSRHSAEQPSLLSRFPSSHSSPTRHFHRRTLAGDGK